MPHFINPEHSKIAVPQDLGKLAELNTHELLRTEHGTQPIASFDQVREIGAWFLKQKFPTVLPSNQALPRQLFAHLGTSDQATFLSKIALGPHPSDQFPATVRVLPTANGAAPDLQLHIVPIDFGALEKAEYGQYTDQILALAAAAAVAPQFLMALQGGIETTLCSSKKPNISSITPDHGTPLAITFDAFENKQNTLTTAQQATNTRDITVRQAAHLHGQPNTQVQNITTAAAHSKIAAGVPVTTLLRSQLPKHALFLPTILDPATGQTRIISLQESLLHHGLGKTDLSLLAAALGFTARVVGDSSREHIVEKVLTPGFAEVPLNELVLR